MIVMKVKDKVDFNKMLRNLKALPSDRIRAKKYAMDWWIAKHLIERFQEGNQARFRYPPLSPEYERWKMKKFGNKPLNVLYGLLLRASTNAQVTELKNGLKIIWGVPDYAKYMIDMGRDWRKMDDLDYKRLRMKEYNELVKIRKAKISR